MKTLVTVALLLIAPTVFAQGIQFEKGTWANVLVKAKAANRLVYLDVYTTWCGPCKMLEANIFPQKAAGDFYNAHFINYRLDAEKGEGIAIAKQYNVTGYPTHLYIEPASGRLVFRGSGYSPDVKAFVHEGEVAGQEWKDPMTLEKYEQQFAAQKGDKAFLKAYLQKLKRLDKNSDLALDAYAALLPAGKLNDEELAYLAEHIKTVDNNAVALLEAQQDDLDRKHPESKGYFKGRFEHWARATYQKAIETKNEQLLAKADAAMRKVEADAEGDILAMHVYYFREIGDEQGAVTAGIAQARYLTGRTDAQYAADDAKALESIRQQMRWQLKEKKVPEEKLDEMVAQNVEAQPEIKRSASQNAGLQLNAAAWDVYEKRRTDQAMIQQGLSWAKRALILTDGSEQWPAVADTYAHLLYASGQKAEAIRYESEAIGKLKAVKSEDVAQYEAELKKMKEDKL